LNDGGRWMKKSSPIDGITSTVAKRCREIFGDSLRQVILYGSYSRGDYDKGSDIDIMVLVDIRQEQYMAIRKMINELSGKLSLDYDVTVSIKIKDNDTFNRYKSAIPFYANVLNEGVIINA
jgi:uncharacterized protein